MKDIEIYNVPQERRYWLVRSKGGSLYDHFISNSVIAISHLDKKLSNVFKGTSSIKDFGKFYEGRHKSIVDWAFPEKKKGEKESSETSKRNQSRAFIEDIKIGDWVVTVTDSCIRVGLITSEPYLSTNVLESSANPELVEDGSIVRRNVEWGPAIQRSNLSSAMLTKLRAQQTVSNLDSLLVDIHHYLFPMFVYNSSVYISVNIGRPSDIPLDAMTQLFLAANTFNGYVVECGADPATVKAYFFSEGALRVTTRANAVTAVIGCLMAGVILISVAVHGNEVTGIKSLKDTYIEARGWFVEEDKPAENTEKKVLPTESEVNGYQEELQSSTPFMNTEPLRLLDDAGTVYFGSDLEKFLPENFE